MVVERSGSGHNDPYVPPFTDGALNHAARWQNGVLTDLKSLPGNKPSSAPFSISENGQFIAGVSETGHYDR